jgi:hypothetical protein
VVQQQQQQQAWAVAFAAGEQMEYDRLNFIFKKLLYLRRLQNSSQKRKSLFGFISEKAFPKGTGTPFQSILPIPDTATAATKNIAAAADGTMDKMLHKVLD